MDASQSRRARREADRWRRQERKEVHDAWAFVLGDARGRLVINAILHDFLHRDEQLARQDTTAMTLYVALHDAATRITRFIDTEFPGAREALERERIRREHERRAHADHVRRIAAADESGVDDAE